MSIYSGFATRNQETFYNKLVFKLIEILQQRVLGHLQGCKLCITYLTFLSAEQSFDESGFAKKILKIYRTLRKLEGAKYLEPHFSYSFECLNDLLLQSNQDGSSTLNSSVVGGSSVVSGFSNHPGFSNQLREKLNNPLQGLDF